MLMSNKTTNKNLINKRFKKRHNNLKLYNKIKFKRKSMNNSWKSF